MIELHMCLLGQSIGSSSSTYAYHFTHVAFVQGVVHAYQPNYLYGKVIASFPGLHTAFVACSTKSVEFCLPRCKYMYPCLY